MNMTVQQPQLVRYEAARKALAEARAVDEVKDIRDKADAMRVYGMQAKNKSLEVDAAEIRIRAERRLGELLAGQKAGEGLAKGGATPGVGRSGNNAVPSGHRIPTLEDAGISKKLSARAQKIAAVPPDVFEAEVSEWRGRVEVENARVTTRLESAGERAQSGEDASLAEIVDELQAENTRLTALVMAAEADDLKSEAIKWRRAHDRVVESQSEAIDAAARSEKREKFTHRQLMRCGRAVGVDDPTKIAAAVEAMAKASRP